MKKHTLLSVTLAGIIFISGCKKEPDAPANEEELITTLILSLKKQGTSTIQNFTFNDPDGPGGIAATVDSVIIDKASIYDASILLLNTQKTPADTISNEVLSEGTLHQFFYKSTPATVLSGFSYLAPNDTDGNPIGLKFDFDTWNWENAGTLNIILRHQPVKTASGVSGGDITNADGETDIEVDFPVRLQ